MMLHVVLYEVRGELAAEERARLRSRVEELLRSIPGVRRWAVGERVEFGLAYEALMKPGYRHAAVIEFDDRNGLRAYLEHPRHAELAALFWSCSERTLVFDYEVIARSSSSEV